MEKCRTARQATDEFITRHMRIARWIFKATNTHSEYLILTAFPLQQRFAILPVLFLIYLTTILYKASQNKSLIMNRVT